MSTLGFYRDIFATASARYAKREAEAKAEGLEPITVCSVMGAVLVLCILGILIRFAISQ